MKDWSFYFTIKHLREKRVLAKCVSNIYDVLMPCENGDK